MRIEAITRNYQQAIEKNGYHSEETNKNSIGNSPQIVEARLIYARDIQHFSIHQLVYLDETRFNLHTSSNYGYSMKNEKAIAMVPANKIVNITLIAAITTSGIIYNEVSEGAYNGDKFIRIIVKKLVLYLSDSDAFFGNSLTIVASVLTAATMLVAGHTYPSQTDSNFSENIYLTTNMIYNGSTISRYSRIIINVTIAILQNKLY